MQRKKILWLVSWYPNKYDRFDGDFIQRHARAAALHDDVHVIFIKQSEQQDAVEEEWFSSDGLTEQIVYAPTKESILGRLANYRQWKQLYKIAVNKYCKKHRPDIVHVQVPWRAGVIALWIKKKYNIPFIVTEHWGIYNTVVEDNIHTKSFPIRYLLRKIYKEAKAFTTASRFLGEGVNETLIKKDFVVVPNVADTSLFFPGTNKYSRFTFLHVSNMVPLKNVEGIIKAFHQFLIETASDAQLILVGNKDNLHYQLAESLRLLNHSVFFKGEIPYAEVATEMHQSHVLVLNSNIENSPCVIGEALCCGLPVVATAAGGIPELLDEHNGLLIEPKNEPALTKAMTQIYSNYHHFNAIRMASNAEQKFSFASVSKKVS